MSAVRPARPSLPVSEVLLVIAACSAAAIVMTFPLVLHATRALPSDLIDTLYNTWTISWVSQRLAHGLSGVWNAPIFYPDRDTLAFSENLFGVAIFVAPIYWLTRNPILTYNVAFLFAFVLSGAGMYFLARSLTGSRAAAAVAGAAYAFSPFRFAQMTHLQMLATGWMPIALWGLHEYFATRARRWLIVFAAATILQVTSNGYVGYFMLLPCAVVFVYELWRADAGRWRAAGEIAVACAAVAVVLLPIAASYVQVRSRYQQVRPLEEIASHSATPRSYLVGKTFIGVWRWLPTAVATDTEKELFPGIFVVALALLGIGRRSWPYALIAVAAFLFSLGPAGGAYRLLLALVPGMNGMRVPARFAIVVVLGLSVLAGYGAAALAGRVRREWLPLLAGILVLAVAADGFTAPLPMQPYDARGRLEDRAVVQWLSTRPQGAVLHLPIKTDNFQELHYQYTTLLDGHPIVNGYSGYSSQLQESLRMPNSPLSDPDRFEKGIEMLRGLGVRYVVVHTHDFLTNANVSWYLDRLHRSPQVANELELFNDVRAFELKP